MKTLMNVVVVLVALLAVVMVVVVLIFLFATRDMCGNEVFSEALSPDKEHKAVVFQRDCGATTGFSTQISIVPAGSELKNTHGNIFIVAGHPRDQPVKAVWLSSDELNISSSSVDLGSASKADKEWGIISRVKVSYGAGGS